VGKTGFDYDVSVIKQFGHNGTQNVDAWGGTAEVGYRLDQPWKPRLSAFYGYASGDKNPNDNTDNRFERFYGFGRPWSANDYIVFMFNNPYWSFTMMLIKPIYFICNGNRLRVGSNHSTSNRRVINSYYGWKVVNCCVSELHGLVFKSKVKIKN
jgi:hypothetical protein